MRCCDCDLSIWEYELQLYKILIRHISCPYESQYGPSRKRRAYNKLTSRYRFTEFQTATIKARIFIAYWGHQLQKFVESIAISIHQPWWRAKQGAEWHLASLKRLPLLLFNRRCVNRFFTRVRTSSTCTSSSEPSCYLLTVYYGFSSRYNNLD